MFQLRSLIAILCVATTALLGPGSKSQREKPPSIEFGTAEVFLGMTVEQVNEALSDSTRHIEFLSDKRTALVCVNNAKSPDAHEGQVTFLNGRAVYAAFHFPAARSADHLAQEIASAVESMSAKTCAVSNYSSHGTGGSLSQTTFDCGSKSFDILTTENLERTERHTQVEITIGAVK